MMYRAITWLALEQSVNLEDTDALVALAQGAVIELGQPEANGGPTIKVNGADITARLRIPDVDRSVSFVSRVPGVRSAMVEKQRAMAREGSLIMLGRDIGSVVLTEAPLKIYLDASAEVRASRRHRELAAAGVDRPEAEILAELRARDEMDSQRHVSPLRPAHDAIIIDTDTMDLDQVLARVREAAVSPS
jgi:cytidylate kinase